MSSFRSSMGLALLFLCASLGTHLIADRFYLHMPARQPASASVHACTLISSGVTPTQTPHIASAPPINLLNRIVGAGKKIRAQFHTLSVSRSTAETLPQQVCTLVESE